MARGRRPTPTVLKLLRGNPGCRPVNQNEPMPKGGLPPRPEYLSPKAAAAWDKFAAELSACGVATSLDGTALELLCNSYAQYLDGTEKIAQHGAVWVEKGDSAIPKFTWSPWWTVANRHWKQVQSMLAEFGMTPSSRSKVATTDTPQTKHRRVYRSKV